ncbi:hypothetical protein B1R32_11916 [Abditibacterium utsteinense]|uniref:Uncharacterized protein n=1 Tax=Abditibacterium utsteinense TaxID=1960156 RepID=A0A2S8SQ21_9BACT|nr:hypothetical protein [Abditibacterium utsteinense]PQV62876.1 hypothetical protein B1R32_11916 [Abditibacterium utsteinense]
MSGRFEICIEGSGEHLKNRHYFARLAGLPTSVINRSKELLDAFSQEKLRGQNVETASIPAAQPIQNGNLFGETAPENPALDALRKLEIHELTPVQAMIQLEQLQKMARLTS